MWDRSGVRRVEEILTVDADNFSHDGGCLSSNLQSKKIEYQQGLLLRL
jgi:hypothetical protein